MHHFIFQKPLHRHATHGSFMRQEKRLLQEVQAREEVQEVPEKQ
jgi:hypothetical protein